MDVTVLTWIVAPGGLLLIGLVAIDHRAGIGSVSARA